MSYQQKMEEKKEFLKNARCCDCFFVERRRNRAYCTRYPEPIERYYVGRKSIELVPLKDKDKVFWCGEFIPK
ncbi:hypothetical protein Mzhil_0407 [Methanosalsum zhilinae DSM 4017]|uniref:Uncharacterized protein n=1 Tax=Methanosalsum zhilinae (strain DSM 4017 / NBRC 107636 / OCM 62 / WeN5) TaxID=679901 RepID=F7XL78_METZD|nr:hypothetical protein [Methanosalsum zhilinae]AEH60282.1 hypothetical protein Mzhil_0407 [Methanosalsum zhilinae DSM 4017]